jgi:hypothetical protein
LESALAARALIVASAGAHAKEGWKKIITRKSDDIAKVSHTVWVVNSNAARPDAVQAFCNEKDARHVLFVSRSRDGKSGSGTLRDDPARQYSRDNRNWTALPKNLGPVTGDIKRSTSGFWFDALEEVSPARWTLVLLRNTVTAKCWIAFGRAIPHIQSTQGAECATGIIKSWLSGAWRLRSLFG